MGQFYKGEVMKKIALVVCLLAFINVSAAPISGSGGGGTKFSDSGSGGGGTKYIIGDSGSGGGGTK